MPSLNTGNAILSNPIKVDSSYNVGIGGAASGSFKLQVTGTTNLTGTVTLATTSGVLAVNTTGRPAGVGGGDNGKIWSKQATTGNYGIATIASATDSFTYIGHNGTDALLGTSYGTTGAYTDLVLQTADTTRFRLSGSTGAATFSSSTAGYGITLNHTSENLRLKMGAITGGIINIQGEVISSGGVYPIVLNYLGGNVGIGTINPSFILDVNDTNASGARGLRISTSSTAAGPALFLYINSGAQTNWAIGNSYEIGNALEFRSSNSFGGNPGTAGTSRMLITNTGNVTINTARTNGANVNSITLSDNVTGVQTPGFGTRILATSNNGGARSAIGFEQDGGTNNDTSIAFYTQFSAASLDRRMTINRNGNVLVGSSVADYGYKLAVATGTQHLGAGFVVSTDITTTSRQAATGIADFSGTSVTFDLASIFPRLTFLNRGLSVTMQLVAIPTYTIVSSGFVVLGRTGNSNVWSNNILVNININGAGINSVTASGTVITVNYSTQISGTAYINVVTIG